MRQANHYSNGTYAFSWQLPRCTQNITLFFYIHCDRTNLELCHKFSMGFESGLSGGVRHQSTPFSAMNSQAFREVCLGSLSCMSNVHWHTPACAESVLPAGPGCTGLRSLEYADLRWSMPSDASPNMYFDWMFWTRFWSGSFTSLAAAKSLVRLQLYTGFI